MNGISEMPKSLGELLKQLDENQIHDHRRYNAVRKFMSFRAREKGVPISGSFELTPLCNLDCKMCYVHLRKEQMKGAKLLDTDLWCDLIRQAYDSGMMYATLTGGECLTYLGFSEVYLYLQSLGVETEVYTNGILLDETMTEFFRKNPPAGIQVSLYGSSEESYEKVTGQRMFERVLSNIKRTADSGIPIRIAVTPNAYMEDGEDLVRLIHSLSLPYRINSGLMEPREETGRSKAEASVSTYVQMLKLRRSLSGRDIFPECDVESLPDAGGDKTNAKGVRCGAGRSTFSISWDGIMRPCNTFPVIAENVLDFGFSESWRRINQQVKEFKLPAECDGCSYSSVCKHCVAEHAADTEIGHASPKICEWIKRMTAEGLIKI